MFRAGTGGGHSASSEALAAISRARMNAGAPENRGRQALWIVAILAPWTEVIRRLHFLWETDPQYEYGLAVPMLALLAALLRWGEQRPLAPPRSGAIWLVAFFLLFLPIRFLQEATPDWSAANWSLAASAAALTFYLLYLTGGIRWARGFAFPVLFILTAVPWPQRFDLWLTQWLMRHVAAVTVEVLGWLGIPAFHEGNLIRLPAGLIGIDEACSGIRSLQAMLMVSLFLGELYRLDKTRRALLLLAGLALALVGNVVRTTLLSLVAAHSGMAAISHWHDPAGFSILCFGLAGLWLFAQFALRDKSQPASRLTSPPVPSLSPYLSAVVILCLAGSNLLVELWYRRGEPTAPRRHLEMTWSPAQTGFHPLDIPAAAHRILLNTASDAASWQDEEGRAWVAYHLTWAPGRTALQSARMHRPETCLEASGAVLQQEFGRETIPIDGGALDCREYLFKRDGAPLYVLFTLYEQAATQGRATPALYGESLWGRIRRAFAGERNLGQESIELAVTSGAEMANPPSLLRQELQRLVHFR